MMNRKKQTWQLKLTERSIITPCLYRIVVLPGLQPCYKEFKFLMSHFFSSATTESEISYQSLLSKGELVIAEYTKDIAETKLQEINEFIKKIGPRFHFITRKSAKN